MGKSINVGEKMKFVKILLSVMFFWGSYFNINAIDLCIHDVDARGLVETICRSYSLNIIGTEKLKGNIDINVENKMPENIIEDIVREKGYYLIKDKNNYYVEKNDDKAQLNITVLEPRFIPAEELKEALKVIYAEDQMNIIKPNNKLIIKGNKVQEKMTKDIVNLVDIPVKQVNVEVYVVALQKGKQLEKGVEWEWTNNKIENEITFKKALKAPFKISGQANLSLIDNKNIATIIAKPNIVAQNAAQAHILIGDRIPVIVEHENGNNVKMSVEYEEAGISLLYTPYITKEGTIDTKIKAAVSTPHLVPEIKAYRITTREAETRVNLKDGEMLVIGGLMDRREEEVNNKIPILGDIPILGNLFSHKLKNKEDVELLIVLKGTIEK